MPEGKRLGSGKEARLNMAQAAALPNSDIRSELSNAILEAVEAMPPVLGKIFSLRHYGDLSIRQIAQQMHISEGQASNLLLQADQMLYRRLRSFHTRRR